MVTNSSRRLRLELLEDRCVPAPLNSMLWIGQEGGSLTDDHNWMVISGPLGYGSQLAPSPYDEMVFDPSENVAGVQGSMASPGGSLSGNYADIYVSPFYPGALNVAAGNTATITEALDLEGGTISGEGNLVISGPNDGTTASVFGSMMPNAKPYLGVATTTVTSQAILNVRGIGSQGRLLYNYGKMQFQGQGYTTSIPGDCYNYGSIDVQGDITFGWAGTGLKNYGSFYKSNGSSIAKDLAHFYNLGGLYLQSGTLELTVSSDQEPVVTDPTKLIETQLNGGGLQVDTPYTLFGGWLDGVGTVTGNVNAGDPSGTYANLNGWVHPGFLPTNSDGTNGTAGRLNITGNLWVAPNAGISIELTHGWGSGVGVVSVTGTLTLNGTIDVYRHDDFTPTYGSMNVVSYGSEAGNGGLSIRNDIYTVDGTEYRVFGADKPNGQNAWGLWVDLSD